ncbi:PAS domain S-box protein [Pseudooceanicola sp. CBS1P-1]|nr:MULTISPECIES: ATP-binding protein [Pseudooceanicola]MBT9386037.1 PAS domain S-box protein [Pseudooceanicola endophyticus]
MRQASRRDQDRPTAGRNLLYSGAALCLALGIFALDVMSPLQGAVAVLYTIVVVILARQGSRLLVLVACGVCVCLAISGYVISHGNDPLAGPTMRLAVSLVAIVLTGLLSASQISAARARRGADARYATIFDAAGFPIWETDWSPAYRLLQHDPVPGMEAVRQAAAGARVRNANLQAGRLFGYDSGAALIGQSVSMHFAAGAEAAQAALYRGLRAGLSPVEVEAQFVTRAGETVEAVLRASLPPDSRDWSRVLVTAIDVTERNRAQRRLAQSHAELAHISRVTTLGEIAASIAHEVNQPLAAVITYAKSGRRWLAREAPDAAEVRDCLDQIAHNGSRAAGVIAGIRGLARKSDPQPAPISLEDVFAETSAMLAPEMRATGTTVRASLPRDLPRVLADRVQIQQVMMNLLLNASQAMAATPLGQRRIDVSAFTDGHFVEMVIRDHGGGLGGRDPEALFRPFFTTKPEGMGMGLTICRSILEQHGGTLVAEAVPQGGLAMRFRLPESDSREGPTP